MCTYKTKQNYTNILRGWKYTSIIYGIKQKKYNTNAFLNKLNTRIKPHFNSWINGLLLWTDTKLIAHLVWIN